MNPTSIAKKKLNTKFIDCGGLNCLLYHLLSIMADDAIDLINRFKSTTSLKDKCQILDQLKEKCINKDPKILGEVADQIFNLSRHPRNLT